MLDAGTLVYVNQGHWRPKYLNNNKVAIGEWGWSLKDAVRNPLKLRANRATVVAHHKALANFSQLPKAKEVVTHSDHKFSFEYKVGSVVTPEKAFTYQQKECASGIHFFMTAYEAYGYDIW